MAKILFYIKKNYLLCIANTNTFFWRTAYRISLLDFKFSLTLKKREL